MKKIKEKLEGRIERESRHYFKKKIIISRKRCRSKYMKRSWFSLFCKLLTAMTEAQATTIHHLRWSKQTRIRCLFQFKTKLSSLLDLSLKKQQYAKKLSFLANKMKESKLSKIRRPERFGESDQYTDKALSLSFVMYLCINTLSITNVFLGDNLIIQVYFTSFCFIKLAQIRRYFPKWNRALPLRYLYDQYIYSRFEEDDGQILNSKIP